MSRKTEYKPELCEDLIEFMSTGMDFKAYAGHLGVGRQTLYDWCERHPAFAEAKEIARAKQYTTLFRQAIEHITFSKDSSRLDFQTWNKIMHNCFREDWAPEIQKDGDDPADSRAIVDELKKLKDLDL